MYNKINNGFKICFYNMYLYVAVHQFAMTGTYVMRHAMYEIQHCCDKGTKALRVVFDYN